MNTKYNVTVNDYLRPLKLAIIFSVLGEAAILLIWGVILYPEGSLLHKFLWTIVFCGIGMGAAAGVFIDFLVVGKLNGLPAIIATAFISFVLLGLFCNFLCFNLDMHFDFFGGHNTPNSFIWNGIVMATLGGIFVGWLCFTDKGNKILNKYGI